MAISFDVTHGKTTELKRSQEKLDYARKGAKTAPEKGGRKMVAIFHAQNPNGVLAAFDAVSKRPDEGATATAIAYIEKFGGKKLVAAWPNSKRRAAAVKTVQTAATKAKKAA